LSSIILIINDYIFELKFLLYQGLSNSYAKLGLEHPLKKERQHLMADALFIKVTHDCRNFAVDSINPKANRAVASSAGSHFEKIPLSLFPGRQDQLRCYHQCQPCNKVQYMEDYMDRGRSHFEKIPLSLFPGHQDQLRRYN